MSNIVGVGQNDEVARTAVQIVQPKAEGTSFGDELKDKIQEVDTYQHAADKAMEKGALEGAQDIHEAMIKLQEAEVSLRLLLEVRNKAMEAYREIMRMQF